MLTPHEFDLVARTCLVWIALIWAGLLIWELVDSHRRFCDGLADDWDDARCGAPDAAIRARKDLP